jgi:hypothetical protein
MSKAHANERKNIYFEFEKSLLTFFKPLCTTFRPIRKNEKLTISAPIVHSLIGKEIYLITIFKN